MKYLSELFIILFGLGLVPAIADELRSYLQTSGEFLLHSNRENLSLGSYLEKGDWGAPVDKLNFFINRGNLNTRLMNIRQGNSTQWDFLAGAGFQVPVKGKQGGVLEIVPELSWQRSIIHFSEREFTRDELDFNLGFMAAFQQWNFIIIKKGLGNSFGADSGKIEPPSILFIGGIRLNRTLIHFTSLITDLPGKGDSYQGLEFSYILKEFLMLRTGFGLSQNGWMAGLVWSHSQIKLAYEFKSDNSHNTSHYLSFSWSMAGPENRARENARNAALKSQASKLKKISIGHKAHQFRKIRYFQKGVREARKSKMHGHKKISGKRRKFVPMGKTVLSINAMIQKGISPARALIIYRYWDGGLSLEAIIRKMNLTGNEKKILLTFKG